MEKIRKLAAFTTQWNGVSAALIVFALAVSISAACSRSVLPGEQEEIATDAKDVPEAVRAAAAVFCARIGGARCGEWYWDTEDNVWECILEGMDRRAEIDITPEGVFSELELVYDFSEVERLLPDVAETVRTKSRGEKNLFIELSLRRDSYLDDIPSLEKAWPLTGVVLEFQCPDGRDFEIDARGMMIMKPVDDTTDIPDR